MLNVVGDKQTLIEKSSFHDCKSFCLDIDNGRNIKINNNVFYKGRVFHVRALNIREFQFSNNLMIAATKRPFISGDLIACFGTWQ